MDYRISILAAANLTGGALMRYDKTKPLKLFSVLLDFCSFHCAPDISECKEGTACHCDDCSCKNNWGGFECKCKADRLFIKEQDACIERNGSKFRWFFTFLILAVVVGAGGAGYILYKYRLRSYVDLEIMAIMSQYMPLDNNHNNEVSMEA
ncbi:hypothetical protein Dsin_028627 [Dipteronia sinensis]|uniref:EGF-like calcium-binding domain-containing protein n=1 Tax=Dipteronia sinensis TaxID=43782 RepID=A0AAD9ZSK8_9ROSI|nr:hypothetical protein Dsin_028627 [Dipteronia sinensis]